jgi:aminoglycoside phosphotransferase (APT) family kinase protein
LTIPESAADITLDWLKSALSWERPGCAPTSAEVEPDFGGPSLLGRLARARLTYAAPDCGPPSVVVKFQARRYNREARIYQLFSEAQIHSVPRLYRAYENGTLILEDLSPAQPGSQVEGCTVQQAREVLSILAEIHGCFWGDLRIPPMQPERFAAVIDVNMKQCWEPFVRRYGEWLGNVAEVGTWMWRNAKTVSAHRLSEPATLFHGDVHAENLLYSDQGPMLIDWQLASRGLAANDVSFFLVKSLTVDQRRENEERLLRAYYTRLPERARAAYGFDRFQLDYRACVTRSILSAIMLVGPRFADRADRFELADVLATRVIAAVQDLDPVEAFRELGADTMRQAIVLDDMHRRET